MKLLLQTLWLATNVFLTKAYYKKAGSLSFTTMLAIVPLLAVSMMLVSALPYSGHIIDSVQRFIFENFVPTQGDKLFNTFLAFATHAKKMSYIQLGFLIVVSAMMFVAVERVFSEIWHVSSRLHHWGDYVRYWGTVVIIPIMILLSLMVSSVVFSLHWFEDVFVLSQFKQLLFYVLPWLCSFAGFSLMYFIIPKCRVQMKAAMFGGAVAMILFEVLKHVFGLYVKHFPAYDILYGAMAVLPLFMVWVYLSWVVILFGATVAHKFQAMVSDTNGYGV